MCRDASDTCLEEQRGEPKMQDNRTDGNRLSRAWRTTTTKRKCKWGTTTTKSKWKHGDSLGRQDSTKGRAVG